MSYQQYVRLGMAFVLAVAMTGPTAAFDGQQGSAVGLVWSIPFGGPEATKSRLRLGADTSFAQASPRWQRTHAPFSLPLAQADFNGLDLVGLSFAGIPALGADRLNANDNVQSAETDWGNAALVGLGVAAAGGIAALVIVGTRDDDPYDLEELCREQGGTLQNGECVVP